MPKAGHQGPRYEVRYTRAAGATYSATEVDTAAHIVTNLVMRANPPGKGLGDADHQKVVNDLLLWGATVVPLHPTSEHSAVLAVEVDQ